MARGPHGRIGEWAECELGPRGPSGSRGLTAVAVSGSCVSSSLAGSPDRGTSLMRSAWYSGPSLDPGFDVLLLQGTGPSGSQGLAAEAWRA